MGNFDRKIKHILLFVSMRGIQICLPFFSVTLGDTLFRVFFRLV